ncbi:MAG TPA: dihydrodipicolinate synthase family protein [Candidatus Acidoferrum sp.]|nr:dihydrodipicolinate synthase family protein [Candidatus Acidoferrum sp.]
MKLHGIFAPLTTPFDSDGAIALTRYRENIARYNQTGLAGYVINGSTSESVLLLWSEVYRLWETAKEAAAPGKILIAGTGAESTAETIEHTKRAAALGFDAALARTPSFYKPAINDDLLAEHYVRVADASRIPVLVYSVPVFTHITVEASLVARVATHPNIIGIKDSSGSVEGITKIMAAAPKGFQSLVGSAATLYDSLQRGAVGAVIAIADAFPEICVEIFEAHRAGDAARAASLQQKVMAPSKLLGPTYGIAGIKYTMDRLGYFGGLPRPPLLPVGEQGRRELDGMLAAIVPELAARQ